MIPSTALIIRQFHPNDWQDVAIIYAQGLQTGHATFETEVPAYETWIAKFLPHQLWVANWNEKVVGWAGLQPVSTRKAYEGVVEITVYIHRDFFSKGIGSALMDCLILESEKSGIWTLYSSVFEENIASIRLHRKHGFREIGYREKIARLHGTWRNTILFERRSKIIGI